MANITKEIAEKKQSLSKLKGELAEAIDNGSPQEVIDKIQSQISEIEDLLAQLDKIPTADDIANGQIDYLDGKTPNAINVGQINMRGLSADDVSKFPVWIVDQDTQDVHEVPLAVAFHKEYADDVEDTIAEYKNSHDDVRAMYALVREATDFVAVSDSVSDGYGWTLPPYAGYQFLSDEKHSSEQGLDPSQYEDGKYFPKVMLALQGFKVAVNGKESNKGKDYNFNKGGTIMVDGKEVVRFITFAGGYTINPGDVITCSGYRFSDDVKTLNEEIQKVDDHTNIIVEESHSEFETGRKTLDADLTTFIKEQNGIISARQESLTTLLADENKALSDMDRAGNEKDAKTFRNLARSKAQASLTPQKEADQANAEVENATAEKLQLEAADAKSNEDKQLWKDETSLSIKLELEKIRDSIENYYEEEQDPNDDGGADEVEIA